MQTANFDRPLALQVYADSDELGKATLCKVFGEKFFKPITERIKTWEDVCAEKGIDPVESLPFRHPFKNARDEAVNAFFMLDVTAEVLREDVVLDWTNENQKKWYCWFNNYKQGSGFSFRAAGSGWTLTFSSGGARLCVDTKEKAEYFGKQFLPIFNKFLNPNK